MVYIYLAMAYYHLNLNVTKKRICWRWGFLLSQQSFFVFNVITEVKFHVNAHIISEVTFIIGVNTELKSSFSVNVITELRININAFSARDSCLFPVMVQLGH